MNKYALTAVGLLVLTNAFVLTGIAYNRSGEPISTIELTERELPLNTYYRRDRENSGTTLNLTWQTVNTDTNPDYFYSYRQTPSWLNDNKLAELGFDLDRLQRQREKTNYRYSDYAIEVYLVLEYQGESYKKNIQLAEKRLAAFEARVAANPRDHALRDRLKPFQREVQKLKTIHSRLYVVDAGKDQAALLGKYASTDSFLLVRGIVGLWWHAGNLHGYIRQVLTDQIHVPLPHTELFPSLKGTSIRHASGDQPVTPRYKITLNYGQRLEPWIESVGPFTPQ